MCPMAWGRHNRESVDSAKARFLAKVEVSDNGCWQWIGAIGSHKRYGICGLAGRSWLAHRAAWFLFRGVDPGNNCVCHTCDNGFCVNPDHLFIGSQGDNVADMEHKGRSRHPAGAAHGRAKLTWEQVAEIRKKHASGTSQRALSREYGVAKNNISRIVKGIGWITT